MEKFKKNIVRYAGESGQTWLDNLPILVDKLKRKWGLQNCVPLTENLSTNFVLTGFQGNTPIILKISWDITAIAREAAALATYNGLGCPKLLELDLENGAIVIERILPGTSLASFFPDEDAQAIKIASLVMNQLHMPSPLDPTLFPSLKTWLLAFEDPRVSDLPLVKKAKHLAHQLLLTSPRPMLIHGDLHHDNLLFNGAGQWLAIDPKGVLGDPAYEVGPFMINPLGALQQEDTLSQILENRIVLFSRYLNLESWRIRDWSFVHAVLAGCWSIEDNFDPQWMFQVAEQLQSL